MPVPLPSKMEHDPIILPAFLDVRHCVLPFNRKEEDNRRARNMPVIKAPKKPHGALRKKEGFTPSRRKPLCCIVPETGLEPALPLQEPGPQPGASANSATPARIASTKEINATAVCPPHKVSSSVWSRAAEIDGIAAMRTKNETKT